MRAPNQKPIFLSYSEKLYTKSKIFKNQDEPMQSLNTRHVKLSNNCNWWNNWYQTVPRICVVRLVKPAVSNVSLLNTKVIFILYDAGYW